MKQITDIFPVTFRTLLAGVWLLAAGACSQSERVEPGAEDLPKDRLAVAAQLYEQGVWATRSSETTEQPVCADTLYSDTIHVDAETYVTAQEVPFVVDSESAGAASRGTILTTIPKFDLLHFNTGASDFENYSSTAAPTNVFVATRTSGAYTLNVQFAWPPEVKDRYTFLAYSPVSGTSGVVRSSNGRNLTYTVPATAAAQPDLCIAASKVDQVNSVTANAHLQKFTFYHALTAVGFAFKGYDVRIKSITLSGVKNKGTVSLLPSIEASTGKATIFWTDVNKTGDVGYDVGLIAETSRWGAHYWNSGWTNITDQYLMMLPQTFEDETARMKIVYEGRNGQAGGEIDLPLKNFGNWEPGKKVMYNIRLKTRPIVTAKDLSMDLWLPGYTTTQPLSALTSLAPDDEFTFTWDADWLRICRDTRAGNTENGYLSGWTVAAGNPLNNIYFFSTTENASQIAPRKATVTVTGKKSGTTVFTVIQPMVWTPPYGSSVGWTPGDKDFLADVPAGMKKYTTVKVEITDDNDHFNGHLRDWGYKVNGSKLHVHYNRSFSKQEITVRLTYNIAGVEMIRSHKLTQAASTTYIVLDDNLNFQFAIDAVSSPEIGIYEWESKCAVGSYTGRIPSLDQFERVAAWSKKIKDGLSFYADGAWSSNIYWTNTRWGSSLWRRYYVFDLTLNGVAGGSDIGWDGIVQYTSYLTLPSTLKKYKYRCLYDEDMLRSKSGGTGW